MLTYRQAKEKDSLLYFNWANDSTVREQSYDSNSIDFINHVKWFNVKLNDKNCSMLIFYNDQNLVVGQVRIEKNDSENAILGISIDLAHRGKAYSSRMLKMASINYLELNQMVNIHAYIKESNTASKKAFDKAGFQFQDMVNYLNNFSYHYTKRKA